MSIHSNEPYAIVRLSDNKVICGITLDAPIGTSGRPIDYAEQIRYWEACETRGKVSFGTYYPIKGIKE